MNDFDSDFDEIISNMKGHVDAVSPKVVLGGLMEARQNHQGNGIIPFRRAMLTWYRGFDWVGGFECQSRPAYSRSLR